MKSADNARPTTNASLEKSPISYNLGFTSRAFVLCPRASEGLEVQSSAGKTVGLIALNGTVLGGTLLVKSEEEWDVLRNDESKLTAILQAIGVPPATDHEGRL